ncbi:titin [Populus alba x Populus x berolinensis]|nr:titin [Populus alba x Populus x berolinensis]
METEGLETVHTSLGGNAVVPEGGSFLEPPSIAKVPGEEILRKLIDQVPCLVEKNEKQAHKDEGFDTTEEGETKEIAEKEKQVDDVTGTILQIDKIEGPSVNIEEEERIVKHVEAMEDGEADVEGKPKSIEKETGGPEKYEEGEMKIEESVELETSNEGGSFEPGLSQGKEALSQTADAIVNNLDNPETVKEVCQEKEIKDSGTGDGTINEQRIGEERKEEEKSGICSSFLDDKGTDVVKAIEKTEKEKEGTTCNSIGGGTYIVEAGIDIQKEKETTPGTGDGMQDKRNTEDIATVTHKTQETEEMYSQQVDKPDVCMVSESESEEIVNRSPQGEGQNLILEKTAEVDSSEGENIKDGMDPEQKPDGLFVKHEENKQSMHQDLAMAEESTEENRDMETPTVIAAENNTSDAVPVTIATAQDHSVIEDDKIMDVVANVVPEDSKEEMSKYEDRIKETFAQQDEAVSEKSENSLALISGEIDTATSSECSEAIGSAKEETPIKIPGESFEDKKEEKPIDADAVGDSGLPIEKSLLPTDLNEKIEDAGLELQYKNSSEVHISHSLEQETIPVQDEKQPKVSDFEPQDQDHEENGPSKDLEKHAEDASEACESMQNTNLENPSAEGAITTEVNSKANEMAVEKEEKIRELESEEKLAIDDAGTNLEEEKQKKEEAHDEQAYQMATSDRIEEVTSDEVCSREFVDKKVERSVQAAGFQEAETPLKNGVGENYEMSSIVNEEVIDEPKITDIGEVIDEEIIKDDATHPSSELVFDEKLVESSQDNETEAEMSKGDGVEEQMMKDDNAEVILQESIQEASVNDFQNDLKDAEKSGREMSEVSEAEKRDETNNNDKSPDSTLQASLLKEQESLQTENLTAEAEEKDEDGSSIRKDEDEDNDNGLKEFKECSEKETLKGEEDVEQISPKNELGENLESSASMVSAETEEVALNKTTQETEEEMDEGVEGVKKEAETGKEDGEEQVIDENDAKSIPIESIKEVTVSKLLDDENNAEEFIREISEESVAAGTNENITDATCQNDGTTPDAAPETSTAKETLKDEEDVEQIPPKNEPGENLERSASMIPAETEEVALNKTTWKTEEEIDEGVEGIKKEAETGKEDGEEQVIDENNAKSIPVESIKEVPVSKLLNDENNAEEFRKEISEESVAAGTNENITDATCQNDGTTPDAAPETSTAKETLKDKEHVEQIPPKNDPGENLESSASMIPAETEEVALNKTTQETEEEMNEGVEGVYKEAETGKEDGEEQVNEENDAKSIPVESIKEVTVSKLLDDENNAEEFKREISEESVAIEKNESIIDETHQNDGTPNAALGTSTVKQVEIVQGEGKDTIPAEASPKEEEEHDRARGFKRVGDNSSEIRLEEDLEKSDEETSKKIDAVAHETNQHIEFPSSTLETSPVEEQASVQRDNLTPEETSPEEKIYEDGSSNKKDEDKGKNTGLAEETRNAGETLKAEESSEQNLQNDNLIENPKQSINMICAETEADAFSKMVDNHEEEIIEIPRGNAEAELFKEENIEVHVVEESNINSLSQESAEESPIKDFQNAAKNSEKATEEMLESQIAGGDETNTNDEDCNSSLPISVDKIDESFEGEDKNITTAEASTHDEKEEHGSLDRADDGNDSNRDLTVTNQDSTREALKVQEDSEQELQRIEPGELEESSTVMAAETEAGILSDKIDDVTSQEEVVTVPNIEETVEKEKKEEHGPLDRAGEGNDCNPDLTVTNQDSAREASKVQEDSEQELQRIEPGELEESSTVMAAETEAGTLSDKIDDVTSQEEVVTIENIEETVEKEKKEEHGPLDRADDGNDSNPDLTVTDLDSAREALKVQEDSEQELQRIEPGEPEESSTVMAAESEAGTLSDKIDDVTSQEEVVTVPNIEETVETEKKEEHGPLDKAGEGNDSNPDLTVTNQDSAREASKVQEDSEQELLRIEPGEPEESSTVMAAETKAGTLSDKIDDVTSQEEVATIQNIEETVEKEKKEEHGPLDRAGDGNDSNPDPTVTNQDSAREASKVQEDSEQELQRIEPGELQESSTVMAAETETGTLSDKIDDVTSQEEVVTVPNIEETVENEKKEVHGSMDKAGEGNDSNPDLTVTNHDSAREASKVQEDSEQELQRIEPGEPEESSTVMAAETEAGTLSDKIDDVTSQEEVATIENIEETVQEDSEQELQRIEPGEPEESSTVMAAETEAGTLSDKIDDVTSQEEVATIENIEETVEKEKKEGSEDIDVTKVKRAVMEEDLKLVAEASDANKSVENDAEDENIISGGKEVETVEKKFELDSIQKLEVEEKRENKEEEAKNEDIKEVCGDTKLASLSVDAEKHVTAEEHTNTDISPQTTGETTAEEKAETVKEMEESVITSVDEDAEKKVPEEESESAINDQSKIIYKGDESGMLVEQEVHEIIQTAEEYGDIGKQGSVIKDSYEAPLSSTNEEIPLHEETEDESDKVKPNEEVKDSKSEFTEPFEARGSVDRQEFETLRGEQGPNNDIYLVKASEGVSEKESSKSPVEISYLESESKGEILEEVQPDVNDSSSALTTGITRETSFKEAEPEDKRQIESFEPAPQEKGPVTESTERTTLESVDIDAKPEDSNFIENEDHGIPAASEAEELENEMHEETPITGSEDYKEETTNETSLDNVLDDKQVECSTILPKEPELMANEGNKATDENSTTYENIETPQTPQEIEIMLKEDMPINARDASKSVDPRIESIKEEVGSYQFDNLNQHHELDNEKQEGIDISKSSEVRDLANQGEICKLMSLEDEYSSNVGDEALKCIEATSAERKEAILEEDNSTKKSEDSFTDNVEANKAAFELEEGTNNQEQAIGTKDYGVLAEENFVVSESGKKLEGVSESETGDQSSQKIPETDPGKVENITEIQNRSLKSVEQSSLESQEVREETGEKTEPRFETEGDVKETQNTDETVKDVLLTEEVHEKVDKAGSETLKCTEKDVNDTLELCAKSTEDERVHEVKQSSLIAEECHEATESNEQTAIMSSDLQEAPTMEEMSLAKAINDEDNEMPAVLSTTKTAEELDEMVKIIKEEDSCRDKIKATTMVEIAKTSLEEAQLDEKPVQVSNITSNDTVSLEIEAEACQQEKIKDNVGLELPSNLASPILDDHENIMREQVAKENADADDVQENERASDVVYESKDHGIEELVTRKIKEENEKSSEIESLGVEAAANEIAIDHNPPEVISTEEQGISATTERREENVKDVELLEDDLRKTEEVPLQMDDCRERDISQLELQSNKDIQNQSPKEVLEEECGTPDETKEEIKEGPKLVSMTSSQGFEALKEDESTSGQTVPEEKLEEQNQTPAAALLSKEKDCGTERILENIEECVQVEIPTDPQNDSPKKITEDTCLLKEETNELEVSGFGVELNTGMQKDSLNEVQVEESKSPDDASKLQTPDYETSKEAFESISEAHGDKGFTASEETEIKEKHPEVAITDLTAGEDRSEKIIDPAEIIHDEVIEEGTFERATNLKTELSKEAFKSISEVHGHEALAESEDTEIKEKHPEVTVTDMAAEENQSERTIDATEIIHNKLKSEEITKREDQEIMEEKEGAKNGDPVTLVEETTKECQEENELKAEESLGDEGTQKDIQNEELYKEAEKADGIEKQMDTERIIEHLHLAAAENETMKESFLDEAGSELHLENQICEIASGNDGRTEDANVKEEEMDVEISQKEVPTDLVEANEATRDIHEEEETSKTTTEHIEEHVKEVEIEVDEHPSAPKTTQNTCSQKEQTKEQEVCGSGVECSTDMQKNGSNEFDGEEGRTPDEDSTPQPQGYENKIKDKEYLPESNKMTEITETGAFEKTSDLRAETGEEAFKSVSEVHEHEVLAESEHPEIKKEKHTEVAVTDLVAGENQNKKTIAATEVVHDEELTKQDKQQFKEEEEDTKNCNPINLGEETTKESRQIHDLKAEESQEDKMENEIQNEEVSNESGEYLHQTAVENETINESFPDEALVENAEDIGTKLQVEKHSDEKTSGYDRTEAITNEEFGTEISEKESLQAPAEANETTQDIHQGERDSDSTSEKPIPIEAEPQETTERKKDAPQVLLQEPIVEATQGAGVGESEPGKATGIVDAQGFERKAERSIDEENIRGNDESMSAKTSLFDMMQSSTRERQVGGELTEETRVEGEKAKSDEEKEEEEEGEEHKKTDSGSDAPVMVEASRDIVDVKVASKKHYNILSGVGSKVKSSISKVKKAITGKSSHPKQHSPK